ncbi:DUF7116 family protein [Halogeometricum limi]|uniref:Uncharacterized protein n=2 Tax=Halogeometricum limi TaxID=555875 RepID=A0A1I6I2M5_9EURY|nr:hypothetical protein [Halogeometricum limi]SFR60937.1 hypothetical protein SAMN04488124_2734 [Halogeometricum limi]
MPPVSMPPSEEARSIFSRLGYTVSGDGPEFVAERKWRTVQVTVVGTDTKLRGRRALADGGRTREYPLRCFVTWKDTAGDLRSRLTDADPSYEWAVIGVDDADTGEYDVVLPEAR